MFKIFEFKDGKLSTFPQLSPKNIKNSILASIIILVVVSLSLWIKIDEKDMWKFYKLLIQQFGLQKQTPKIDSKKEIDARIELKVDEAIDNVTPEYDRIIQKDNQKYLPRYIQEKNNDEVCYTEACKSLGGPMRMCAPWYAGCPSVTEELTNRGI